MADAPKCRYCGLILPSPQLMSADEFAVGVLNGSWKCSDIDACRDRLAEQLKAAHADNDNQATDLAEQAEQLKAARSEIEEWRGNARVIQARLEETRDDTEVIKTMVKTLLARTAPVATSEEK